MTERETDWKDPTWCYILAVFLVGLTNLGIAGVSAGILDHAR